MMTGKELGGLDVVTGGAGFIGSHVVDELVAAGRRVRVVDSFVSGNRANLAAHADSPNVEVVEADIADLDVAMRAMEGAGRVFHLAALADIVPSIQDPRAYFRSNVDGTFAVVEAARAHRVSSLVYAASSSCYGIPDVYPTPEATATDPRYPYALTKYLGEQIVLHWARVYDLPFVSLRLFNVYGPRSRTSGTYGAVFGVFLAQILAGKPLTVVGDGEQVRDFVFVTDVVQAFLAAAERGRAGEVYNVGSGRPVSVNRLVELLGASDVVHIPKRPGEPDRTHADPTKIESELGWRPTIPIEEGVRALLKHIDYWREAPVWTVDKIADATQDWFRYLGRS